MTPTLGTHPSHLTGSSLATCHAAEAACHAAEAACHAAGAACRAAEAACRAAEAAAGKFSMVRNVPPRRGELFDFALVYSCEM